MKNPCTAAGVGAMGVLAISILIRTVTAAADVPSLFQLSFGDASGVQRTVSRSGPIDQDNPFFRDLGTNGRRCVTCHRPAEAWTITPPEVQERFDETRGLDPLFRTNDGSNCEGADVSTLAKRRQAFSMLLAKGLIRVGLEVPSDAEFDIVDVDDPHDCGAPLTGASLYRRPLPSTNLAFLSAVMWDGRETVSGQAIRSNLITQAKDATMGHAQGASPTPAQLDAIVDFEMGLYTAQTQDRAAGALARAGALGGPAQLSTQSFCIGINDPFGILPVMPGACLAPSGGLNTSVFSLFGAWANAEAPERRAIARGEQIFNSRRFVIDAVGGLNGGSGDPLPGAIANGSCTVCHDAPNAGSHSVAMPLNLGLSDASRRTADLPLYTLENKITRDRVQTTDPGRAMITGKWQDIGKFKGPVLRGLAARAPYFHNGAAATLDQVVDFYNARFNMKLTTREKADLVAFLSAL